MRKSATGARGVNTSGDKPNHAFSMRASGDAQARAGQCVEAVGHREERRHRQEEDSGRSRSEARRHHAPHARDGPALPAVPVRRCSLTHDTKPSTRLQGETTGLTRIVASG